MCGLLRSESQCVVYTMSTYECLCRWVNFLPFHLIYSPLSVFSTRIPFFLDPSRPFLRDPFCLAVIISHPIPFTLPQFSLPFLPSFHSLNSFTFSILSSFHSFSVIPPFLPSFHSFSILPSFS